VPPLISIPVVEGTAYYVSISVVVALLAILLSLL
jgi:hypothetical protein